MDELHIGLGLCGEEDTLTCHCCQVKSCECVLRERELVVAILWLWCSRSWVKPLHSFSITCTLGFSLCGVRDSLTLVCEFQSFLSFVRRLLSFLSLERETLILTTMALFFIFGCISELEWPSIESKWVIQVYESLVCNSLQPSRRFWEESPHFSFGVSFGVSLCFLQLLMFESWDQMESQVTSYLLANCTSKV
jgi:hypothetical protein